MESSTENNQIHRSVLLDHKMVIEGIQYHEKKEMQRIFNEDGVEMSNLSHMRSIGVRTYTANQKIVDGEVKDETIETTLDENDVAVFETDWEESSFPRIHLFEELPGVQKPILLIHLAFLVAVIIFVGVKDAFPEVGLQMIGGMSMIGYFVSACWCWCSFQIRELSTLPPYELR